MAPAAKIDFVAFGLTTLRVVLPQVKQAPVGRLLVSDSRIKKTTLSGGLFLWLPLLDSLRTHKEEMKVLESQLHYLKEVNPYLFAYH